MIMLSIMQIIVEGKTREEGDDTLCGQGNKGNISTFRPWPRCSTPPADVCPSLCQPTWSWQVMEGYLFRSGLERRMT